MKANDGKVCWISEDVHSVCNAAEQDLSTVRMIHGCCTEKTGLRLRAQGNIGRTFPAPPKPCFTSQFADRVLQIPTVSSWGRSAQNLVA